MKKCGDPGCGLLWLDPVPIEEDIDKAYQDYHTHRDRKPRFGPLHRLADTLSLGRYSCRFGYERKSSILAAQLSNAIVCLFPLLRTYAETRIMFLDRVPNGRVLDIGCGAGHSLKLMQELGWRAEGLDTDPEAVRNARAKGLRVSVGALESLDYPDSTFDALTMSHVIEHVHDVRSILAECRRILVEGGKLVMLTPNSASLLHRMYRENWRGLYAPRHLRIFNRATLGRLCREIGFSRVRVFTEVNRANRVFITGYQLKRQQTLNYYGRAAPWLELWGMVMQAAQSALLTVWPDMGEELVVIAEK
jgi:SAM-dependent methyltransferase